MRLGEGKLYPLFYFYFWIQNYIGAHKGWVEPRWVDFWSDKSTRISVFVLVSRFMGCVLKGQAGSLVASVGMQCHKCVWERVCAYVTNNQSITLSFLFQLLGRCGHQGTHDWMLYKDTCIHVFCFILGGIFFLIYFKVLALIHSCLFE